MTNGPNAFFETPPLTDTPTPSSFKREARRVRVLPSLVIAGLMSFLLLSISAQAQEFEPDIKAEIPDRQFGTPPPSTQYPFQFDNHCGEWINYETPLEKPVIVFSEGANTFVAVINEPDEAVEIFDMNLVPQGEACVALGPSALAQPPGSDEIWATCHQGYAAVVIQRNATTNLYEVTQVVRPNIPNFGTGARGIANPAGIAFNSSGNRGCIASSMGDSFIIVDRTTTPYTATTSSGVFTHNAANAAAKEPRSVAYDSVNDRFYVTARRSANDTFAAAADDGFLLSGLIIPAATFGLTPHGVDVMAVNGATGLLDKPNSKHLVGVTMMNCAVHPNGNLVMTHMDARQDAFIGEGSFPNGKVVRNLMTIATPAQTAPPYTVVDLDALGTPMAMPTDITFDSQNRIFIAAYASNRVGVFDAVGNFIGSISTLANPRGLAVGFSGTQERLYVQSRGDNAVECFDISGSTLPPGPLFTRFLAFDPTFDRVKKGRKIFNDATNSGCETTFCGSCHQDLQTDGMGHDLSKFYDVGTSQNPPQFPKDEKLAMVTQDLRNLSGTPPYHWRGEQKDLEDFNPAFVGLLQAPGQLPAADFACLKEYVLSAHFHSNPNQRMDRFFSASATNGVNAFHNTPYTGNTTCVDCHEMPSGTDSSITDGFIHIGQALPGVVPVETTHMWGLFAKDSHRQNLEPTGGIRAASTGYGTSHGGNLLDSRGFVTTIFTNLSLQTRNDIADFQDEWDTGTSPAANYCEMLDQATSGASRLASYFVPQANAGFCGIAFKGRIKRSANGPWIPVGYYYDPRTGRMISNRVTQAPTFPSFTPNQFITQARNNLLAGLVIGVPPGSEQRVGVDRDRDAMFDGDEMALGLLPTNPDFDNDGFWDGEDSNPTVPGSTTGTPSVVPGSVRVLWTNTNAAKICYQTDLLSATSIDFGLTTAYGRTAGDPIPLASTSNEWKHNHTVFARLLKDNSTYHFRVRTYGQNTMSNLSGDMTFATSQDFTPSLLRVVNLQVTPSGSGTGTTFQVTCQVIDNCGAGYANATVGFVATHLMPVMGQNPLPNANTNVDSAAVTNGAGNLSFTWTPPVAFSSAFNSGDFVEFSLQMARDNGSGGFVATITDNNPTPRLFNFPESQGGPGGDVPFSFPGGMYCVRVTIP